jgi:hypothetical protein
VHEQEREGVGADARLVDEVQVDPLELDPVLVEGVELRFLRPPVEPVAPVLDEALHVGEIGAQAPVGAGHLVGKAGAREALPEILEDLVGDVEREGLGGH